MSDAFEEMNALFSSAKGALEPTSEDVERNYRGAAAKIAALGAGAATTTVAGTATGKGLGGTALSASAKAGLVKGGTALMIAKWVVPLALVGTSAALAPKAVELVRPKASATTTVGPHASTSRNEGATQEGIAGAMSATPIEASELARTTGEAETKVEAPISASDLPIAPASGPQRGDTSRSSGSVRGRASADSLEGGDKGARAGSEGTTSESAVVASEPLFEGAKAIPVTPALAPELSLVQRIARAQRAGKNDEALALVREHETKFSNGVFREEREALRALATCASGDADRKGAAASTFSRAFPSSALLARVRGACR